MDRAKMEELAEGRVVTVADGKDAVRALEKALHLMSSEVWIDTDKGLEGKLANSKELVVQNIRKTIMVLKTWLADWQGARARKGADPYLGGGPKKVA